MLVKAENLTVYSLSGRGAGPWKQAKCRVMRLLNAGAGEPPALKNITCVFPGGISIILGPNGSGKTTLLKVLAGLILPDSGSVIIDEKVAGPVVLRQAIGYLPQNFGLYPSMTAREMLCYIGLLKGIVNRQTLEHSVEDILRRMGLLAVADRKVGVFSRGMRQKVGIAQALLGDPPILLLDEPTAGLDPAERNKLRGLLTEIGQNRIIVWTSSIITDTYCADRVMVLNRGESCFEGTAADLAACAAGNQQDRHSAGKGTDDDHWSLVLEQGYRAVISAQVSK